MNFYVYYSYEEWGRGYIGSRKCVCEPEQDTKYFGSYYDPDFSPTNKIIIEQFSTQEEAIECEIALHDFFQVDINPHFANQSKQRRNGFYYNKSGEEHYGFGKPCPEHSERMKGQGNPMYGKRGEKSPHFGKKRPEHSKRMSGENNPNYGKTKAEIFGDRVLSGAEHPYYGKKRLEHSLCLKGRKWWTSETGEVKFQHECPGEGWIESDTRRKVKGEEHPLFGKKNPKHSEKMSGNKHWINEKGDRLFQRENPGEGWQRGLKWKSPQ
jgi:hypothetical protein